MHDLLQSTSLFAASAQAGTGEQREALKAQWQDLIQVLSLEHILLIAAIGLISLTLGWRFYFGLAILLCAGAGFLLGVALAYVTQEHVSDSAWYPVVLPIVGAVAFGAIAIPYLRAGIFAISGVVGGYAGYAASLYLAPEMNLLFAVAGFVIVGLVSMAFFQLMVVVGTSLLGSAALVLSGTWLLHAYSHDSYAWLLEREGLLPLAALFLAFLGIAIQLQMVPEGGLKAHFERTHKYKRKREPREEDEKRPSTPPSHSEA